MEQLKHECGVAMIRLRKPIGYYKEKYGTYAYALNKLYLLMEKQHNRGQEGAGVGVVKLHSQPGHEYVFRERALGPNAITDIFSHVMPTLEHAHVEDMPPLWVKYIWGTCAIPRQGRAAFHMSTRFCGVTTGAHET